MSSSDAMDTEQAAVRAYYERGEERDRLSDGRGQLEYIRTTEIVARRLPPPPAVIADIGGGPGRYALWLASLGYQVEHRDLMPLHVSQLQADAVGVPDIRTAIGGARALDLPDGSADAVLLLGPLYHLASRADRTAAIREAVRILRPGGPLFATAISRWAARVDGIIGTQIYLKYPAALDLVDETERAGILTPLHEGAFSAYSHRPGDLRAELTEAVRPDGRPSRPCRHPRRGQGPGTRARTDRLRPPPGRYRDPPGDRLRRQPDLRHYE
jgi:SAM-dependent methyltransferase